MDMDDAEVLFVLDDEDVSDVFFSHKVEGFDREGLRGDGFRALRHDVLRLEGGVIDAFLEHSSEVAIGDGPHYPTLLHHGGHAKAFAGDFQNHILNAFILRHLGLFVEFVEVFYFHIETFPQDAARVIFCEIPGSEATQTDETTGQCITHRHLSGGAAGRGEIVGARLLLYCAVQHIIRLLGKKRINVAD